MAEHKPTWMPWHYASGGQILGRDGNQVAYLAGRMNNGNADVAGNFMAAAPELYQALEGLIAMVDQMARAPSGGGGGVLPADYGLAKANAREALTKARGEI